MSPRMKDLKAICTKTRLQVGRAGNTQRPKSVAQWSVVDVQKWLRRHCGDFYHLYCEAFLEQEVREPFKNVLAEFVR